MQGGRPHIGRIRAEGRLMIARKMHSNIVRLEELKSPEIVALLINGVSFKSIAGHVDSFNLHRIEMLRRHLDLLDDELLRTRVIGRVVVVEWKRVADVDDLRKLEREVQAARRRINMLLSEFASQPAVAA